MRTKDDFVKKIDEDLIWRRRELTDFRAAIQNATANSGLRSALTRAGVALLYAHWEGFIKKSGTHYLEFVGNQGKKASELKSNFIAIKMKSRLDEASKSAKASTSAELVEFFRSKLNDRLRLPHKGIVDTESNLSSKVLREIIWILGLSMSHYETKSQLIDSSLVSRRNHIAHGSALDINLDEYLQLHDDVMSLIDEFRNQLQNAVATDAFLQSGKQ